MKITNALKIALKSLLSLQMGEVKTDKSVLVFDGDELKEGMEVFVLDEEGNAHPAEDGDYTTDDGKIIKVVEGKVAEIVDPDAEVDDELGTDRVEQESNEQVDPADAPEEEAEDVSSVEDRIAEVEARLAEFTDGLNKIINAIAALEERIAAVEGKLAKVEEPAADPVDETPEVKQNSNKSILSYLRKD